MDSEARDLIKMGGAMFARRSSSGLDNLWQEICENLYPERADFVSTRREGSVFAENLFGSYPLLARRELGDAFGVLMRPRQVEWASVHLQDDQADKVPANRKQLEWVSKVHRRAIYDPVAGFVDATKQADHDVAAIGNAVIWAGMASTRTSLLFKNHHVRDCAWLDNADGETDALWRKWNPTARMLVDMFGYAKVAPNVQRMLLLDPEKRVACYHIAVPERLRHRTATPGTKSAPFSCLYVDAENERVYEDDRSDWFPYVVPRWARISDSAYARSPATEIVLPDARTFQVVIRTLREAGEKHVDPPMLVSAERLRSDVALYAGGHTLVDMEYDDNKSDAIRPVDRNTGGMPIGMEIAQSIREDIRLGSFLDKLKLPVSDPGKFTAYEFQKRVEQMSRDSAPIFEPIEDNYNAPLCALAFNVLRANGAYGPPDNLPDVLRGAPVTFTFRSPFREAIEQAKAGLLADGIQRVLLPAAQIDPHQLMNAKLTPAVQDALRGLGWPEDWINDPAAVAAAAAAAAQQKKLQEGLGAISGAGGAAKSVGEGLASLIQPAQAV